MDESSGATNAEGGKLRPGGHMWPNQLVNVVRRASQSLVQKQNEKKKVVSLMG